MNLWFLEVRKGRWHSLPIPVGTSPSCGPLQKLVAGIKSRRRYREVETKKLRLGVRAPMVPSAGFFFQLNSMSWDLTPCDLLPHWCGHSSLRIMVSMSMSFYLFSEHVVLTCVAGLLTIALSEFAATYVFFIPTSSSMWLSVLCVLCFPLLINLGFYHFFLH